MKDVQTLVREKAKLQLRKLGSSGKMIKKNKKAKINSNAYQKVL